MYNHPRAVIVRYQRATRKSRAENHIVGLLRQAQSWLIHRGFNSVVSLGSYDVIWGKDLSDYECLYKGFWC